MLGILVMLLMLGTTACPRRAEEQVSAVTTEEKSSASSSASAVAAPSVAAKAAPSASAEPSGKLVPEITLAGVDTTSLTKSEKQTFSRIVDGYLSPCGDPSTIATCVTDGKPCKKCLPAAKSVAYLVAAGGDEVGIRDWLDARFDPKKVKTIPVTGAPTLGVATAKVRIVEFIDFECPHCAMMAPIIEGLVADPAYKSTVSLTVKNFPLNGHVHSVPAACAAVAAQAQGKFFPMYDALFKNQEKLENADLEGYARAISLDVPRFKLDCMAPATKTRVDADKKDGELLGIEGTPSIFIEGRKFKPAGAEPMEKQLRAWIDLELALLP